MSKMSFCRVLMLAIFIKGSGSSSPPKGFAPPQWCAPPQWFAPPQGFAPPQWCAPPKAVAVAVASLLHKKEYLTRPISIFDILA